MSRQERGSRLLPWLSVVIGAGGLVTSFAYYFGWVYLREQYAEYGTSVTIVGYTRPEIVFRSLSVFIPAAVRWILAGVVLWLSLRLISDRVRRLQSTTYGRTHPRYLPSGLVAVAVVLVVVSIVTNPSWNQVEQGRKAEWWLLGAAVASVLMWVGASTYRDQPRSDLSQQTQNRVDQRLSMVTIIVVVVMSLAMLYTARSVATDAGLRAACEWERDKHELGQAVLVSERPIGISATTLGIPTHRFEELEAAEGHARPTTDPYVLRLGPEGPHEYGGLRILTEAGGRYWIFAAISSPRNGILGVRTDDIEAVSVTVDIRPPDWVPPDTSARCRRLLSRSR